MSLSVFGSANFKYAAESLLWAGRLALLLCALLSAPLFAQSDQPGNGPANVAGIQPESRTPSDGGAPKARTVSKLNPDFRILQGSPATTIDLQGVLDVQPNGADDSSIEVICWHCMAWSKVTCAP